MHRLYVPVHSCPSLLSHPPDARQDSVESGVSERPPVHYVRNLLVMSVAFFFLFASYCSVRNLQVSVRHRGKR